LGSDDIGDLLSPFSRYEGHGAHIYLVEQVMELVGIEEMILPILGTINGWPWMVVAVARDPKHVYTDLPEFGCISESPR